MEKFREATARWNKLGKGEEAEREADEVQKSHVIVVTDACLPLLGSVDLPLCACMLINYELPTKKVSFLVSHASTTCFVLCLVKLKCALVLLINICVYRWIS